MQFLIFIIQTLIQLYIIILLLRFWMQLVKADFNNPFYQFIIHVTQPNLKLLHNFIPAINSINIATLLSAYFFTMANIIFIMWVTNILALISIKLLFLGFIQLLTYAGKLIFWLILIRAILSWIKQDLNPINYMLIQLIEPLMLPIRQIIPTIGGLDFSNMIVMFILITLNYLRLNILLFIEPTIASIFFQVGI